MHGKYALSVNVIHSLTKPLQKGGIFSVTCCKLSAQTYWDAAVAAATASSLQERQEGAVGKEMASVGKIYFTDADLEVPAQLGGASQSPHPAWQAEWAGSQPAASAARVLGVLEKYTCCASGTHLSFPGCSNIPGSKRSSTLQLKSWNPNRHELFVLPHRLLSMAVTAGRAIKEKRHQQTAPRALLLYGCKRQKKTPKPQGMEQTGCQCHKNSNLKKFKREEK